MRTTLFLIMVCVAAAGADSTAIGGLPFGEDFDSGTASWRFSNAVDLTHIATGGVEDGGYVSQTFAFSSLSNPAADSALIFRAQEEYGSSGAQYAGNWAAEGVQRVSAFVRHSAPVPLVFNVRLSNPANFPGASYGSASVPANSWTQIDFDVTPASPQNLTYEGADYATVFSNIGHIQFGVDIPPSLRGGTAPLTFDLDQVRVTTVPEPTAWALAAFALAGLAASARRAFRVA